MRLQFKNEISSACYYSQLTANSNICMPRLPRLSWGLWPHILIEVGLHHAIVNLAVLVCLPSDISLGILVCCNEEHGPAVEILVGLSDLAVQFRHAVLALQPLSVGGIGDEEAVFLPMAQILQLSLLEVDVLAHLCHLGIFHRGFDGFPADIVALDVHLLPRQSLPSIVFWESGASIPRR